MHLYGGSKEIKELVNFISARLNNNNNNNIIIIIIPCQQHEEGKCVAASITEWSSSQSKDGMRSA